MLGVLDKGMYAPKLLDHSLRNYNDPVNVFANITLLQSIFWFQFVMRKREKWKPFIKASLHFRQRRLRRIVDAWKVCII